MWHHSEQQTHNHTLHLHTAQLFSIGCPETGTEQRWARVDKVSIPSDKTGGLKALRQRAEFTNKSAFISQECFSALIHMYS